MTESRNRMKKNAPVQTLERRQRERQAQLDAVSAELARSGGLTPPEYAPGPTSHGSDSQGKGRRR